MAVLTAFTTPRKPHYKIASVSDDVGSLSDDCEHSYCKVKHLSPLNSVFASRQTAASCTTKFCIVALLLIVSVSLNVVVSIYLWRHRDSPDSRKPAPYSDGLVSAVHEDSVCTVCTSIGVQPESVTSVQFRDLSVHLVYDGFYLCCMHNAHGLRTLVSLFADRFPIGRPPEKDFNYPPANKHGTGAHLYIDSEALRKYPPTLFWTKEYGFGSAYNSSKVLIDGNQLHVKRSGLYHIYSFLTFKTKQRRLRPDNVIHTVNRRNKHLPELGSHVMLIDKTTLPEVSERFVTSFLSATVRLRQDDQIFVQVSNLSYIYRFAPSNFFGLYFVGDG